MANSLVATTPVAGSTIQSAPSAITITTQLALMDAGNEVTVTDPTGVVATRVFANAGEAPINSSAMIATAICLILMISPLLK